VFSKTAFQVFISAELHSTQIQNELSNLMSIFVNKTYWIDRWKVSK